MAYALLADLSPEYGLYTSFVGAALYWVFGTSKDIVIGAERPGVYSNEEIAKALSALSGIILLFIGLVRLGWIIEFIPYIPISAFVTGASITIMATQFPVVMGIRGVNTREAPYLVIINSLKRLPQTRIDAAIGLTSIALLYAIRYLCAKMEVRYPSQKKAWAMISSLRLTFTMLLYTLVSWLVNRNNSGPSPFRIVGKIERGFKHAGAPPFNSDLLKLVLPELPAVIIILVIEHIAIAKSFARTFNYTVVPSQEILAQGASNLLGTFVGGYRSYPRLGLHVLTSVFYYIPNAALAGLIVHAVANLPTPPQVSIYVTICVSLALVLIRVARGKGLFLGQSRVHHIQPVRHWPRDIYLPLDHDDGSNPAITVSAPHPGVFIYQFPSGLNYMNQGQHMRRLVSHIKKHTRPGAQPLSTAANNKNTSLQWSEVGKQKEQQHDQDASLPRLRAVVLDCTAVDTLDITAVQGLVDARDALDRHAGGEDGDGDRWGRVQWHFAGPWNRWARRALAVAGGLQAGDQ
ncbi:hypothetical protein NEMBOFW57_008063 [Staphylotrichum longicolle]|uniref:STAS domain-containing protein n=1 Tax=Staphylotrichum longicolle TaxID=669026 RepID=A0AAD4HTW7_9PEZI|nr:hypothetical protein NEMBOFW57_008063 [Staphylotrichum longicolle]